MFKSPKWRAAAFALAALLAAPAVPGLLAQETYHLTARPWKPAEVPRERYLDAVEGLCRFSIRHQDADGAIIDPFLHREHQYATPYFACAVATLVSAGRARDLLPNGIRAMEHATRNFGGGRDSIPDQHGEFFIASLTEALELYRGHVPAAQWQTWAERLRKPYAEVIRGSIGNWETYLMKGEWLRALAGLAPRAEATAVIERAWAAHQRARFAAEPLNLYHDRSSDPDSLSVEAVGRGNLLALIASAYDGPSAAEIQRLAEHGTASALLLQDPSGQAPANGRTDDHVWVDVGYALAFEVMAERTQHANPWLAGQYRHAAMLGFESIARWRRASGPFAGSYFITKNHFDPALRVGYQDASQYSNYNGSLMFHLAETYAARTSAIPEHPAPAEIGGYAFATDAEFASAFANAGGFQMQANLRGQVGESSGNRWTPLGVVRFARPGWDTRLGPSDGALTAAGGVSFAPAFEEEGRWLRMADLSARYEAVWSVEFVHPLLVRCSLTYRPRAGQTGPVFRNDFTLTPDAVLSEVRGLSPGGGAWGVTWPLLENDGAPLQRADGQRIASVRYPGSPDQQNFLALDASAVLTRETALRGTYGDLRPIRVVAPGAVNRTLVYPRRAADPEAEAVRRSFTATKDGFRTVLATVSGTTYVGRTAAGGFADAIALNGDARPDIRFSRPCGFLIQLSAGKPVAAETDREVAAVIQGHRIVLKPYTPVVLP